MRGVSVMIATLVLYTIAWGGAPADSGETAVHLCLEKTGLPFSVEQSFRSSSLVSPAQLQKENARTTPAALKETTGLFLQETTCGHGTPIMRGFIGRNNLLLVDGIRLNNGTWRSGPSQYLNTVDNLMLDHLEIIRGPSSTVFGSDAMGGVVNAIVRTAPDPALCGAMERSLTARFSSADQGMMGRGEISGSMGKAAYRAGISYKQFDDLRAGGTLGVEQPTGYQEYDYNADLRYQISATQRLNLSHQYTRQNDVPRYDKYATARTFIAQSYSLFTYDPQIRSLWSLRYAAEYPLQGISALALDLSYHQQAEVQNEQKVNSTTRSAYDTTVDTLGFSLRLESPVHEVHTLQYGGEAYTDTVNSSKENRNTVTGVVTERPLESTFPDGSSYEMMGAYLQDTCVVAEALSLTAGGRYNRVAVHSTLRNAPLSGEYDETFEGAAGTAGFTWAVGEYLAVVGSLAQGIRAPNLDDTVTLQTTNQGVDVPVAGLQPEKSLTTELGIKKQGRLSGAVSVYYSDVTDLIERKPGTWNGLSYIDDNADGDYDTTDRLVWQKTNIGKARIYGGELESAYALTTRWNLWGNLAWTMGDNVTDHEPLTRMPPLFGTCGARCATSVSTWVEGYTAFAAAQTRLSSRDLADPRIQPDGTPGWMTANLRAGLSLAFGADLTLAIENIADAPYRLHGSGVDASGRNFALTYRQTF